MTNGTVKMSAGRYNAEELVKGMSMHNASRRCGEKILSPEERQALAPGLNPILAELLAQEGDEDSPDKPGGAHKRGRSRHREPKKPKGDSRSGGIDPRSKATKAAEKLGTESSPKESEKEVDNG